MKFSIKYTVLISFLIFAIYFLLLMKELRFLNKFQIIRYRDYLNQNKDLNLPNKDKRAGDDNDDDDEDTNKDINDLNLIDIDKVNKVDKIGNQDEIFYSQRECKFQSNKDESQFITSNSYKNSENFNTDKNDFEKFLKNENIKNLIMNKDNKTGSNNIIGNMKNKLNYRIKENVFNEKSFEELNDDNTEVNGLENSLKTYKCDCRDCMNIAIVCCGDRSTEAAVMIKSLIKLSNYCFVLEIFTQIDLFQFFQHMEENWPEKFRKRVRLNLRLVTYPTKYLSWKNWFRQCATVRLFFPSLLRDLDSILYLDTDLIFLTGAEQIWNEFKNMNEAQLIAVAPEHGDENNWYKNQKMHPYYGKYGVNAGIMLMNLTRLRDFDFEARLQPIVEQYPDLPYADQDIINILFSYYPEKLHLFGCEYNYRLEYCSENTSCPAVFEKGIKVVHGSQSTFYRRDQLFFNAFFDIWKTFRISEDILVFESHLKLKLAKLEAYSKCPKQHDAAIKNLQEFSEYIHSL